MMVHHYSLTSVLLSSAIGKIAFVHMIPFFAWAISSFLRFLIFPSLIFIRFFVYLSVCRWHFFVSSFICFFVFRRSPAHPRPLNHSMLFCFFVFLSGEPLHGIGFHRGSSTDATLHVYERCCMPFRRSCIKSCDVVLSCQMRCCTETRVSAQLEHMNLWFRASCFEVM